MSEHQFYHNVANGESQWEFPDDYISPAMIAEQERVKAELEAKKEKRRRKKEKKRLEEEARAAVRAEIAEKKRKKKGKKGGARQSQKIIPGEAVSSATPAPS